MKTARQRRPIRAHAFQPFEHHFGTAVGGAHQASVAFLATGLLTTHRRHEKSQIKDLEFDLQKGVESKLSQKLVAPPIIECDREFRADSPRLDLVDGVAEQHEQ